jgi:multidrug efflux system membrane fusion protein
MQEERMEDQNPGTVSRTDTYHQESSTAPLAAPPSRSTPSPKRSKWARLFVWAALLLTFAVIFFLVLRHHDETQSASAGRRGMTGPVTVTTATAQKGNIGIYLDAIGTVTPTYTASITSQVTGLVSQVHYKEGQVVRKGEPLIEIDARPFEAQLMEAEGSLQRDTNFLAEAQMDLARYREAWAKNGIPKQTLDDQEKVVLQDEGTVKNDQGTVQYEQVQVGFCHIVAPISGRVGLRLVDPGNVVQANSTNPLVVITQVQPITVIFTVAEDNLAQVQEQTRHGKHLSVDALDRTQQAKIASGKLLTVDNQIDTTTGTVKLRAIFDNKNGALFPNQFVNTRLLVNTLQGVTLIPNSTIQRNGQTAFVYLIQNGAAQIRNIQTGVSDGGVTAVTGINPGDVVANSSFEKLQNGSKINVSKQPPAPAANTTGGP